MILVSGAAGKTGTTVIRSLVDRGEPVRALVYREEQIEAVESAGASEWTVGDLRSSTTLAEAVEDVQSIYHICPNVHADEVAIGREMIAAAEAAQVERFVYYSVLQPASYMHNVLAQWRSIAADGIYKVPYAAETLLGMVDLEDGAAAACFVLTEGDHAGATYELAGPEVLSGSDVAAIFGRRLEQPVQVVQISRDEWA